jgi:predicted PurR-regulated permease PerM
MLVAAAAAGVLLFVTAWAAPVIAPLGLGLFLAALAAPLFGRLTARGASAPIALVVTIGLVLVIGAAIIWLDLVTIQSLRDSLSTNASDLHARYDAGGLDPLSKALRDSMPADVLVDVLRTLVDIVRDVAVGLGFAVIVAALLLLDSPRLARLVQGGAGADHPVFRDVPRVARAAVTYFLVRIRVNLVTAIALLVLMLVLGVDDAPLWAVGAFFLSFVPYVGLVIALIPPTILAFAESGIGAAVALVIGGTALNLIAENLHEPTLTSRALTLATWFVFLSFYVWVGVLGPIGALLSMPISVLLVLVLRGSDRSGWAATLLARDPADDPVAEPRTSPGPT